MSLRKAYKTDVTAETSGVWVPVGYNEKLKAPVEFKLARRSSSNKPYATAMERKLRPYQDEVSNKSFSRELGEQVFKEVFLETILLDWRNVSVADLTGNESDEDKQLEFSRENADKLMAELPELYQKLFEKSGELAVFSEQQQKAATKN